MTVTELHVYSGKVRDIYDAGEGRLLLVASDRISAFDVVMAEPVPDKGRVLTGMSAFWFERFDGVVGSHLISTATRRAAHCRVATRMGRPRDVVPPGRDVAHRVHRPRVRRGLGLEGVPHARHDARIAAAGGSAGVVAATGARVHAVHEGRRRRSRRQHLLRAGRRSRGPRDRRSGARRVAGAVPRVHRETRLPRHARHGGAAMRRSSRPATRWCSSSPGPQASRTRRTATPSPVKAAALELGLTVTHHADDVIGAAEQGAELGVVVAFGQIIKPHVLAALPMVNVHFSLLPRSRAPLPSSGRSWRATT